MSMVRALSRLACVGLLLVSTGSFAHFIENVTIHGDGIIWLSDGQYSPPGGLTPVVRTSFQNPSFVTHDDHLRGTTTQPGDNIELGILDTAAEFASWLAGGIQPQPRRTVLQGVFDGGASFGEFTSLAPSDWEENDYRLVKDYVSGFLASIGESFTDGALNSISQPFVETPLPGFNGSAAFLLSDPNISFIRVNHGVTEDHLQIGLAATLDLTDLLQPLLDPFSITLTPPVTASEVVRYNWGGGGTRYFYAFTCEDSNQDANDGSGHSTSSYSCTAPAPEPTTLLLMGLGLAGIGYWRRRLAA